MPFEDCGARISRRSRGGQDSRGWELMGRGGAGTAPWPLFPGRARKPRCAGRWAWLSAPTELVTCKLCNPFHQVKGRRQNSSFGMQAPSSSHRSRLVLSEKRVRSEGKNLGCAWVMLPAAPGEQQPLPSPAPSQLTFFSPFSWLDSQPPWTLETDGVFTLQMVKLRPTKGMKGPCPTS